MARTYETFRLSDNQLLNALASAAKTIEAKNATFHLRLDDQHTPTMTCPVGEYQENADIQSIVKLKASVFGGVTLNTGPPYNSSVQVKRTGVSDSVTISIKNDLPIPSASRLVLAFQEVLKPYERDESFDKLLGNELAEFYRKREHSLVRLEELAQRIVEQNEEYRKKLDQESQAVQARLKEEYGALSKELKSGYEKKEQDLNQREESLEVRIKEIDDRSSRHARRQIRKDLKDAIAKRNEEFTLTRKTTHKRVILHFVFLSLIGMLAGLLVFCLTHPVTTKGVEEWFHLFRLPLLAAGTAAALIYYIKWNDLWFRRHADEEFLTKRFDLDVDRASWLVEMALEWKDEKGAEIPTALLDRLSANLFDKPLEQSDAKHPSEDLLSALLSASAELNLKVPGLGTIRLDRKGAKQFKRAVENSE